MVVTLKMLLVIYYSLLLRHVTGHSYILLTEKVMSYTLLITLRAVTSNPHKNNQAVKNWCGLKKAWVKKSSEIKSGSQEMAAMMLMLTMHTAIIKNI